MGRKSVLTNEQWAEIERQHLVEGESINSLAKEFGANEGTIREKINPNKAGSASGKRSINWEAIRAEYEAGASQASLAKAHGVSRTAIQKHIAEEG